LDRIVDEEQSNVGTALITGASSGIGRATAIALAAAGFNVSLIGRRELQLREVAAQIGSSLAQEFTTPQTHVVLGDVRVPDDCERMALETLERFSRIDVLVAAAGIDGMGSSGDNLPKAIVQLPTSIWDDVIDTNLKGTFLINRAVIPAMLRQGRGHIINVSSARGGVRGMAFSGPYCASKHGIMGLSKSLAEEVGRAGIRVHALLPDVTDTPMLRVRGDMAPEGLLDPEQVAAFVVNLVQLPDDVTCPDPLIAPFARRATIEV
jgi:NAD(P)-dependent dehydrogenase (short-subunit alcohol dehydrogenase family)